MFLTKTILVESKVINSNLFLIQDEKIQNVANPGFEGIKKWLEVFLLSGGTSFDANLQLSALIKDEVEMLKIVFMNMK